MNDRHRTTLRVAIVFVIVLGVLGQGRGRSAGLDRYASTMNPAVRLTFFLNKPVSRLHIRGLTTAADILTLTFWGLVFGRFTGLALTDEEGDFHWRKK
ncbi:MAG: hypothetical protein ACYTGQ_09495 [Planctomycetota bacterium]|jgi:hypothetical protein